MTPLERLFSAIWLNHDPRKKHVLMATAYATYFDASGTPHDHPVFFIAGYVSTAKKWCRFEQQWNALLKEYKITPPFHMKEFAPGVGQYESWKSDKARRDSFYAQAISIIKTNVNKSLVTGVVIEDLQRVRREYNHPLFENPPYVWCGLTVCKQTQRWMRKKSIEPKAVEFVFEHGDSDQYLFAQTVSKEYKIIPIFRTKADCVPFQAADMLAWEQRRAYIDHHSGKVQLRRSAYEMYRQIPNDGSWGYFHWAYFESFCKKQNIPKCVSAVSDKVSSVA